MVLFFTLTFAQASTVLPMSGGAATISLHVQDISVRAALQLLAELTKRNIVVSDKVTGKMTLNLDNVSFEEALHVILTTHTLTKHAVGSVLIIGPRDEIAVVEKEAYDAGHALQQVLIETRIVNVSKDIAEDLGIRWEVNHPDTFKHNANQDTQAPLSHQFNFDFTTPTGLSQGSTLALAYLGPHILLDLELSALESENKAKVIASPRVVAADQEEAYISSGQQIPYQESTASGATSVSFRQAVLSLRVTPKIMTAGRVMMQLKINQDRPSSMLYNGVPAIVTKEIDTHVLVKNGQTVVLGGIIEKDRTRHQYRVPLLGSLPLLGPLFTKTQHEERDEELLVFITPTILTDTTQIHKEDDQSMG